MTLILAILILSPYEGKGHVITMNNFFSSIPLFKELLKRGTYATGTIRSNRVGLPDVLKDAKVFKKSAQSTLQWRMHESRQLSAIMWKDKKPVVIISSHAVPIQFPYQYPVVLVSRRNGSICGEIQISHAFRIHHTHAWCRCGRPTLGFI